MEIKNDDGIGKIYYIGLAFENPDDALLAQKALSASLEMLANDPFTVTSTSTNVHTVIEALLSIDNNYQAVCMTCRDVISMCPSKDRINMILGSDNHHLTG